jgi:hypothetical protein
MSTSIKNSKYSITPIIRTLVVRISNNPDRLGPSSNFVENSRKLICVEITGYRIVYSTVMFYSYVSKYVA